MRHKKVTIWSSCALVLGIILIFMGRVVAAEIDFEGRIYFNTATAKTLVKAAGITETLAEAIVVYRVKCGYFKDPEDLLRVPGLTKEVYRKINPQRSPEGYLYCVPKKGVELDEEDEEEPMIAPSKPLC